jgi:hypothetical protein
MAEQSKSRKAPSRSTGSRSGGAKKVDVKATLQKLGVDDSVIDVWQDQARRALSQKVQTTVDDFDVKDAIDMAKRYASMSSEKLKDVARSNPKKFYSGIAAILVGAGLLAAAAKPSRPGTRSGGRKQGAADTDSADR